jgi:U3 small nucleolar RNA-associated protein 13
MKIHLELKRQLRPILTSSAPRRAGSKLYTNMKNTIVVTDLATMRVEREIPFDSIRCFDVHEKYLVVCSADIVVYDIVGNVLLERAHPSKVEISCVQIDRVLTAEDRICVVVGRVDGNVSRVDVLKKEVLWSHTMGNAVTSLRLFGNITVSSDINEVWLHQGGEVTRMEQPHVVGMEYRDCLYTITSDGVLSKWGGAPRARSLGIRCSGMVGDKEHLYITSGKYILTYDYKGELRHKQDLITRECAAAEGCGRSDEPSLEEDESMADSECGAKAAEEESSSGTLEDDESYGSGEGKKRVKKNGADFREHDENVGDAEDIVIQSFEDGVITTNEQEIFILDGEMKIGRVIIGNNDEITDMVQWNDILFTSTNSGRLRYTDLRLYGEEGEYAFGGQLVSGHTEAVMSLSLHSGFLLTTSRDGRTILWKISQDGGLRIKKVLKSTSGGQNACAMSSRVFAIGGADCMLEIWDYRENVFMSRIHEKEINSVEISEERRLIATASQDKTAKVLGLDGRVLHTLVGHSKGVWHACFGKNMLATCSTDKSVRLWSLETFACIGVLEGHMSAVLKGAFYKNDAYLITGSLMGEIKVWNVGKRTVEYSISCHNDKVWALLSAPTVVTAGNGTIAFFEDDSLERASREAKAGSMRAAREVELERCLREDSAARAVEILAEGDDHKMLYRTLIRCYNKRLESVFDVFEGRQSLFFKTIEKEATFKNAAAVHWLLQGGIRRNWLCPKDMMEKIYLVAGKHSRAVDEIYVDLLGFTAYELA